MCYQANNTIGKFQKNYSQGRSGRGKRTSASKEKKFISYQTIAFNEKYQGSFKVKLGLSHKRLRKKSLDPKPKSNANQ